MKLLYHHRTRCSGADGTHIKGVVSGFEKLGYETKIISPRRTGNESKNNTSVKTDKNSGLFLRMPRVIFELLEIMYNFPAFCRLFIACKTFHPDIIYERYAFLNLGGILVSAIFGKPLFLEVNFTTRTQVYPIRTGIFSFLETSIEEAVFKHASIIVVISDVLKNDIANHSIAKEKILVLPNAVNIEQFCLREPSQDIRAQYNITKDNVVIGFVGSFYPWHGIDFLLDSINPIIKRYRNVRLVLIGVGQMVEAIKEKVRMEQLESQVFFSGAVPHDILDKHLALFDIGVMPDSNDYGSPMKIFEYMAMGMPIVAPRLKPIEAVITDGKEGLLFTQRDQKGLCDAITRLIDDRILCKKMGEAGRSKVCRQHTWDKNVGVIISHYENLKRGNQ